MSLFPAEEFEVCPKCGGAGTVWDEVIGADITCKCRLLRSPDENRIGAFHGPDAGAPPTELGAAIAVYPRSGTARRRVLDHIALCRDRGATDEECSIVLRMRLYTAAPRRNELLRDGWIIDSGRRRATTTGSHAVVWVLSEQGRQQWVPA